MCGRYTLYESSAGFPRQFGVEDDTFLLTPRYNIAPMQVAPVVRQDQDGKRRIHLMRWGLVPFWSKDEALSTKLINARAETLQEKPSFRSAFKTRRCIIPASGFYEWKPVAGGKQPYYIHSAQGLYLGLAGLWEHWKKPDGETLETFTIVTTDANESMRALHDRMPVIISPSDYSAWLTAEAKSDVLPHLLQPCAPELLGMYPVSKEVGNVRNDSPELIRPK